MAPILAAVKLPHFQDLTYCWCHRSIGTCLSSSLAILEVQGLLVWSTSSVA